MHKYRMSLSPLVRHCLCVYLTRVPPETSQRPFSIIFASAKLTQSLLQRLGYVVVMMQSEQNFVRMDISY